MLKSNKYSISWMGELGKNGHLRQTCLGTNSAYDQSEFIAFHGFCGACVKNYGNLQTWLDFVIKFQGRGKIILYIKVN